PSPKARAGVRLEAATRNPPGNTRWTERSAPEEVLLERALGGGRKVNAGHWVHHRTHLLVCDSWSLLQPRAQWPLKFALPFSPKALIPSSASSDTKMRPMASRSSARPR